MPTRRQSQMDRWMLFGFGVVFIVIILWIYYQNPFSSPNLNKILNVVLALASAGIGASIPGVLRIDGKASGWGIRASGAMAMFCIVIYMTSGGSPDINASGVSDLSFSGKVVDATGSGVADARVVIESFEANIETNNEGNYKGHIRNTRLGNTLLIKVFHPGFREGAGKETVSGEKMLFKDIKLSRQ